MISDILTDQRYLLRLFEEGKSLFHPETVPPALVLYRARQLSQLLAVHLYEEKDLYITKMLDKAVSCLHKTSESPLTDFELDVIKDFRDSFDAWKHIVSTVMLEVIEFKKYEDSQEPNFRGRPVTAIELRALRKEANSITRKEKRAEILRAKATALEGKAKA